MITEEILSKYLSGKYDLDAYARKCQEIREAMLPHSRGVYPERIELLNRPGETPEQKEYRKAIWKEITYPAFLQVTGQVQKIRRSKGFGVSYPEKQSSLVKEGMTLADYMLSDYPEYDNIMNLIFGDVWQANAEDANGVLVVYPKEFETGITTGYMTPVAKVFTSFEKLAFVEGQYCIILKPEKNIVQTANGVFEGKIFLMFDEVNYYYAKQTSQGNEAVNYTIEVFPHLCSSMPVWLLGSHIQDEKIDTTKVYKSPLEAFRIPCDESLNRYSDVQVMWNNHVHAEKVIIANTSCKTCNGNGKLTRHYMGSRPSTETCGVCHGSGQQVQKVGPLGAWVFGTETSRVSDSIQAPHNPVSYVEKPFEATRMLDENYRQLIADGFKGLGLEYLNAVPLNESGKAKEYDRQEINTFFNTIATRLMGHIRLINWYTLEQRYFFLSPKERNDYFNQIQFKVPDTFDVLSTEYYQQQYINSISTNESPIITGEKAKEYGRKEYGENNVQYYKLSDAIELDPYPGLKEVEKIDLLAVDPNNIDAIISQKMEFFLNRAYAENANFFELAFADKYAKLQEYAQAGLTRTNVSRLNVLDTI